MRTDFSRGLSDRERDGAKAFRKFIEDDAREQREREDREQFLVYCSDMELEQAGTPPALRVPVLSYEEWSAYLPADETDPVLRRTVATFASLQDQNRRTVQKQAEGTLPDWQLQEWGFNLSQRPAYIGGELQGDGVKEAYYEFQKVTPSYDHATDWDVLQPFMARNKLVVSLTNLRLAWDALVTLNLIPERPEPVPAPAPAPAPNPELNRHGVNLSKAAPDSEKERERVRHAYRTDVVVIDPDTGEGFTQHQLDHVVSADRFKALTIGRNRTLTVRDVIGGPWGN